MRTGKENGKYEAKITINKKDGPPASATSSRQNEATVFFWGEYSVVLLEAPNSLACQGAPSLRLEAPWQLIGHAHQPVDQQRCAPGS